MPRLKPAGERNVIGQRVCAVRLAQSPRVSQDALAARLAVRGVYCDRSAISRMEAGGRFIRDYEIIAIAEALKIPVAAFFETAKAGGRR